MVKIWFIETSTLKRMAIRFQVQFIFQQSEEEVSSYFPEN